jgi:quinolinate synthase
VLPDLAAGCSMADMAAGDQLDMCWRELKEMGVAVDSVIPVTYINSSADIKAFCGEHGGIVCTSTNAAAIAAWAGSAASWSCCPTASAAIPRDGPLDQMVVDPNESSAARAAQVNAAS